MLSVIVPSIIVLSSSLICGLVYRFGGQGKPFNTKWRDLGCPIVFTITMILLGHWHWSLILCFGALFGACTTYNKWVGYFFNRPDKSTVYWESWFVTGLLYGISALPFVIVTNDHYLGFALRSIVLAGTACLWSEFIGNDFWEEFGRGFLIIATIPLLFLF